MQNQVELEPQPGAPEGEGGEVPEGNADKDAKQKYTYTRRPSSEKLDPSVAYKNVHGEGEWGSGDAGYKVPKTPGERMKYVFIPAQSKVFISAILNIYALSLFHLSRKNVPYKYKFRRNWGDF